MILRYLFLLLVEPLRLIIEFIYFYAYRLTGNCGLSIFILSLAVNFLVLPLYNRANDLQLKAKAKEDSIRPMVDHIKKTFKGDERVMMLQTYYRQAGYSQFNSLKGSISLILQIPFFIAASSFLSDLKMLQGVSFLSSFQMRGEQITMMDEIKLKQSLASMMKEYDIYVIGQMQ